MLWWKHRKARPFGPRPDDRLPDGDTVLRPGAQRWTTLYRSECARTDRTPLLTPGQAHRSGKAPWLNRDPS